MTSTQLYMLIRASQALHHEPAFGVSGAPSKFVARQVHWQVVGQWLDSSGTGRKVTLGEVLGNVSEVLREVF